MNYLTRRLVAFLPGERLKLHYTSVEHFPFLQGLNAHYHVMNEQDYQEAIEQL
jgi:hypothetical protein